MFYRICAVIRGVEFDFTALSGKLGRGLITAEHLMTRFGASGDDASLLETFKSHYSEIESLAAQLEQRSPPGVPIIVIADEIRASR